MKSRWLCMEFPSERSVQIKLNSRNSCLVKLLPNAVVLDVEQALANAFVAAEKYDNMFPPEKAGKIGIKLMTKRFTNF